MGMFISNQYDFDWNDAYECAFYGDHVCNRVCDCAWTWDNL